MRKPHGGHADADVARRREGDYAAPQKSTFRGFTMYSDARILHEANRLRGKLLRRFILRLLRPGPRAGQLHPS